MMRRVVSVVVVLLLSLSACAKLGEEKLYEVLGSTTDSVRTAFNADAGKVRVLMVVSPTCGACLKGASEVSEEVAKISRGGDVPVYVLWVPRLGGREQDVPAATRVVATPWARQYWDGEDLSGVAYKQVLSWRDNAWDVYMLYGRGVRWSGDLPPTPDYFMDQASEKGPRLDADTFGAHVTELLQQR
jgi:hypothetical protein